jgi:hypothetical protein
VNPNSEVGYRDELLADGSVHRVFTDGREEWRRREGRVVAWRDSFGASGTDEPLNDKIIKRSYATGQAIYGREQGYGRTWWSDGRLTVNRTTFGGRMGVILGAVGAGVVLGALVAPPLAMSFAEEEDLRQQAAAQQQQQSSSSDGGGSGGSGDSGGSSAGDERPDDEPSDDGGAGSDGPHPQSSSGPDSAGADWSDDGGGIDDDFG